MKFLSREDVEKLIAESPQDSNTKFLASSHSLWVRFHNYKNSPPMAIMEDDKPVCIHFATFNKNLYTNSYEIVTMGGHEGKGYARKLWSEYIDYAVKIRGMERLKNSCVPSSVTWHIRNGLIFWAIDPTGSLKTDQPLFSSVNEQKSARSLYIKNPSLAYPKPSVKEALKKCKLESYNFGEKKKSKVLEAINNAGKFWLGDQLG